MVIPFEKKPPKPNAAQKADSRQPTADSHLRYAWDEREQRAVPIAIDSPPRSPRIIETNQYVPYETTQFRNAYAWAGQQVARKFPHAVETLSTLDSLIEQQLNATSNSDE